MGRIRFTFFGEWNDNAGVDSPRNICPLLWSDYFGEGEPDDCIDVWAILAFIFILTPQALVLFTHGGGRGFLQSPALSFLHMNPIDRRDVFE